MSFTKASVKKFFKSNVGKEVTFKMYTDIIFRGGSGGEVIYKYSNNHYEVVRELKKVTDKYATFEGDSKLDFNQEGLVIKYVGSREVILAYCSENEVEKIQIGNDIYHNIVKEVNKYLMYSV